MERKTRVGDGKFEETRTRSYYDSDIQGVYLSDSDGVDVHTLAMEQWEQKARAVLNVLDYKWKYIAMNENGEWYVYTNKPEIQGTMWNGSFFELEVGRPSYLFDLDPAPDWKNSLLERSE